MGVVTGGKAIADFLKDRADRAKHHPKMRLVIQKDQIHYVERKKLGLCTIVGARLGLGPASMKRVVEHIEKHRKALFPDQNSIDDFNRFITETYNRKRTFAFKRALSISAIGAKALSTPSSHDPSQIKMPDYSSQHIRKLLSECQKRFKALDPKKKESVNEFRDSVTDLNNHFFEWRMAKKTEGKEEYKADKQLLNDILDFKNQVRAACLAWEDKPLNWEKTTRGKKPLKGGYKAGGKLLKPNDQNVLKANLKSIREHGLKEYNGGRSEQDEAILILLRYRLGEIKGNPALKGEEKFLEWLLTRLQKKHSEGKRIALPKWYHCTKDNVALKSILKTYILYMKQGMYPGCFVANRPETTYGSYCIALSEYIEKTGIREGDRSKKEVLPTQSNFNFTAAYPIRYSDTWIDSQQDYYVNNQDGVGIWFGFQRGRLTFGGHRGTEGIPLKCTERVKTQRPLKYYKDKTVAFITHAHGWGPLDPAVPTIAKERRLLFITFNQAEALRELISATFHCTLPKAWEGKIQHASVFSSH